MFWAYKRDARRPRGGAAQLMLLLLLLLLLAARCSYACMRWWGEKGTEERLARARARTHLSSSV